MLASHESLESAEKYPTLNDLALSCLPALHPPERLTVAQCAEKYRFLANQKAYIGKWRNDMVPYLVEPMNVLTDYAFRAAVFVGPAQCGKTEIILNWILNTVISNPADMLVVEKKIEEARDFSKRRVAALQNNCPAIRKQILGGRHNDNILSKKYVSGANLMITHPSKNSLAGKPIPFTAATDYDRFPLDIDGEGSAFRLLRARTKTFGRHGMTLAESSPSQPILDPNWSQSTPHEAPPTRGILSLYNQGDRRRWYWICVYCKVGFEPDFPLLKWPSGLSNKDAADKVELECPHCAARYRQGGDNGSPTMFDMNKNGLWLRDGEKISKDGEIIGNPPKDEIASFWLKGVAAAFQSWPNLVLEYLNAEDEYRKTGDENSLKAVINTEHGNAYLYKSMESDLLPEQIKGKARDLGTKVVPPQVKFLVAAIDVQRYRFEVLVLGVSSGGDLWVVDRFRVRYSNRVDEDYKEQREFVAPFVYDYDWRKLLPEVLLKTYPLDDESGRHMRLKAAVCDSGGEGKATSNSYRFWRWLRDGPAASDPEKHENELWNGELFKRFQLFKGLSTQTAPRTQIKRPDSKRSDKYADARGDIPVLMANVTILKNDLHSQLWRDKPGTGQINFPSWLPFKFYKELCAETFDAEKLVWRRISKGMANESWDLFVMAKALLLETSHVGIERIDWDNPPGWAADWDDNDLVFDPSAPEPELENNDDMSIEEIARKMS